MRCAKKEMFMRECALLENRRDRKRLMMNKRNLHMSTPYAHGETFFFNYFSFATALVVAESVIQTGQVRYNVTDSRIKILEIPNLTKKKTKGFKRSTKLPSCERA